VADRVVRVRLTAQVAEYVQGMEQAAARTRDVGDEASRMAERGKAFDVLGKSMLAVGTIAAVAVGLAVAKFMEFDAAMSNVEAATNESADNMDRLREAALDAGARTVFSATEAANAIEELGKAGVSTQDILDGGLDGALDLAAAGGLGVAEAAGIAAVALKTFGLRGTDMSHVADLLAAGAGKAMGDVTDLSAALNQAGLVAEGTGLSIEETTAGLAAFASAGLLGSDAGTSFKSMLQRLTPQSAEAKSKMEELGISAYDAQGQFVGLSAFAGNLKDSLKSLTPEQRNAALAVIFGSDAVRAANVLYNEGAEGIDEWTTAVNDQGYASEQASKRLDNLSGDVEGLGGAFDTALIKTGSGANDVLRDMTQTLTAVVAAYGELPGPIQQGVLAGLALTAAVALAGGAFLVAIPKVAEFRAALITLEPAAPRAIGALRGVLGILGGPWGLAITAGIAALTAFGVSQATQASEVKALTGTLDEQSGALTENSRKWIASKLQDGGILEAAKAAGIGLEDLTDAIINQGPALDEVDKKVSDYYETLKSAKGTDAQATIRRNSELLKSSIPQLTDQVNKAKDAFDNEAEAVGDAADAHGEGAEAADGQKQSLEDLAGVATDTNQAISDLAEEIRNFGSAQFDVEESTIALYDAFDSLKENLESGSASLDVTTQAGRDTGNALLETAKAANDNAAAIAAVGGSNDAIAGALDAGRQRIIDARVALGDSRQAAELYADQLIATPAAVTTAVALTGTDTAIASLDRVKQAIRETINLINSMPLFGGSAGGSQSGRATVPQANGGLLDFYANGGLRENHVAQIAPAGSFRVWAEPETGGEAYIPLAPSKRARSLDIWQETGRRLGVDGYAGGGMYAADRYAAAAVAAPQISFNAPIVTSNGTLVGMIQGVAGETVEFRLAQESDRSRAGARRI